MEFNISSVGTCGVWCTEQGSVISANDAHRPEMGNITYSKYVKWAAENKRSTLIYENKPEHPPSTTTIVPSKVCCGRKGCIIVTK